MILNSENSYFLTLKHGDLEFRKNGPTFYGFIFKMLCREDDTLFKRREFNINNVVRLTTGPVNQSIMKKVFIK